MDECRHNDSSATQRRPLDPSELGTKEYWDEVYARELGNYRESDEDEGTVWFSESGAEEAVLRQLRDLEQRRLLTRDRTRFLDLGTGNGHMLFALREDDDGGDDVDDDDGGESWLGEMVGVDYSEPSVQLARRIAAQKESDVGPSSPLRFEQWDLLSDRTGDWLQDGFDVILDKGTFDAISLMPSIDGSSHPCEVYRERVSQLVKPGYFVIVTSCNWTKAELLEWLAPTNGLLSFFEEVKYPTFTFGGQTGQSVVTVVFKRTGD